MSQDSTVGTFPIGAPGEVVVVSVPATAAPVEAAAPATEEPKKKDPSGIVLANGKEVDKSELKDSTPTPSTYCYEHAISAVKDAKGHNVAYPGGKGRS